MTGTGWGDTSTSDDTSPKYRAEQRDSQEVALCAGGLIAVVIT